ncbi:hypothetical protein FXB40_43590 [Bradyrhizobium rifense]|uniref:Uncharacterized protein n=1 Tax=Bradyrhizobium rifense TaxID=515499 RepID=A0A5D3K157_9BRAD|nr:hypothetical protein [Bradyrhizobium rifense]TYL85385.1 hypothetical protein FXB40_43590 [Bradyrhizobium rifense]
MRIREENRNAVLLSAVALCCAVVTGTLALFEPVFGQGPEKQVADNRPIDATAEVPVRVVGAPFVSNVNPLQR